MSNIEDSSNLFDWWLDLVQPESDWNEIPNTTRRLLLSRLKMACLQFTALSVSDGDLLPLIQATDLWTVFDAVLSCWILPNEFKNKYSLMFYLKKEIVKTWRGKHTLGTTWHKEVERKKKGKDVSIEVIEMYRMALYKNGFGTCSSCGRSIRSNNKTGVCSKCQARGKRATD